MTLGLSLAAALTLAAAPAIRAQNIRTVVTPEATAVRWDNNLGLENKALYGGRVDLEFDRWISLEGYFHTNNGVQTAAEKLGVNDTDAGQLGDQRLRLRSYGANVKLQLASGDLSPYIDFGGGVLEFRPDNADRSRQVALNLGGGLRLNLFDPLRLDLFARDQMFRINRFALFAPPSGGTVPADPNADDLRHNLVVGAGLGIPFGPARTEASTLAGGTPWGVNGFSFALEPVAGQLKFDTPNLADQSLAGIRAGFDIGPLVGLRGFYWRGVSDNFSNTNPVQSWSGEAQFRLNSGTGIAPFLLVGGGQVDFKSSFRNQADQPVSDRTSFIAGGGVAIPLGERVALNLAARDYMFGEQSKLTDVSSADNLTHNWMWSAGLRFSVGGNRGSQVMSDRARRDARVRRELEAARDRRDSLERQLALERMSRRDSMEARTAGRTSIEQGGEVQLEPENRAASSARSSEYVSGRQVTIPVPSEGELYVKYGPGETSIRQPNVSIARRGLPTSRDTLTNNDARIDDMRSMSREEIRDMIRSAIREERVDARLDALHDELARDRYNGLRDDIARNRLDALEQQLDDRADARRPATAAAPVSRQPMTPSRSRTGRPLTSSGGEVTTTPDIRVPVGKDRAAMRNAAITRDDLRALLDSMRMERRSMGDSMTSRSARSDSVFLWRVDSVVNARLQATEAARRAERDSITAAYRDSVARIQGERDNFERVQAAAQARPTSPSFRHLATTVYGGATVSNGAQAVTGLRVDLGPIGSNYTAFHFLPELALGWGGGGRSTMVAGNVQFGLPTLRLGNWPAITPQIEGGLGILNFSDDVSGRDGTDGVINLGYGVGVDLWRRRNGGAGPVLVVDHQGVDLFDLNRVIAGLRWTF